MIHVNKIPSNLPESDAFVFAVQFIDSEQAEGGDKTSLYSQ